MPRSLILHVDAEILMDQYIAQTGDLLPLDLGRTTSKIWREVFGGFPIDLQITNACVLGFKVDQKLFTRCPRYEFVDVLDGLQNVVKVDAVATRYRASRIGSPRGGSV